MQGPSYGRPSVPGPTPAMLQPTLIPPPQPAPPQLLPSHAPHTPHAAPQPQVLQSPQVPVMRIPAAQPPPYPYPGPQAARTSSIEPWQDALRLMMFLWGAALLVAFATPLQTSPDLVFSWKQITAATGTARLLLMLPPAIGLLSLIVAAIPMPGAARGLLAAILGLSGVLVPVFLVAVPPWRPLSLLIGTLLIIPGLIMRGWYRGAILPRLLVTIGAIGILAPWLVPEGGAIPLIGVVKGVVDLPGIAKVQPALALGSIVVVLMSLLAWLPAPATGGAALWAWLLILWGLFGQVAALLLGGNIGDAVTRAPNPTLVAWISGTAAGGQVALGAAFLVLVGYGLASVVGKQLE
jgi:hypothetical protein